MKFEDLKKVCYGYSLEVLKKVERKSLQDRLMRLLNNLEFDSVDDLNDYVWFEAEKSLKELREDDDVWSFVFTY